MFFSLDVLRARKGDCLMLHFGSKDDPHLILIDGGPSNVYKPHLKPRIEQVHAARGLEEEQSLPVDVIMVSHVDDDHIKGILELTKEQLVKNPDLRLDVTSLWHNTFDDLLNTKPDELLSGVVQASFAASASRGSAFDGVEVDTKDDGEEEEVHQTIDVLASISQGRQLRDDREALQQNSEAHRQWKLNHKFGGRLIVAKGVPDAVTLDGGLKITVAGPMQPELEALQEAHDKWLREQKDGKKKTPEAMLAAFVDESVPNLSSIVVFAELDGKTMLLTGDARGDKIMEGLELAKVLPRDGTRHINLIKVPHHGSDNNMETIFFQRLPADHYVFSGDGEHGNPERKTLQMLLDARGPDANYTVHLTYPVDEIDEARKADWEKEQTKEKNRKKKNPASKKEVREDWSPAKHSVAALFENNPEFGKKVVIVDEKQPHLIDLLEPLKL
jgi:beta-lactamase superfamily II metal-dependent hydrolase